MTPDEEEKQENDHVITGQGEHAFAVAGSHGGGGTRKEEEPTLDPRKEQAGERSGEAGREEEKEDEEGGEGRRRREHPRPGGDTQGREFSRSGVETPISHHAIVPYEHRGKELTSHFKTRGTDTKGERDLVNFQGGGCKGPMTWATSHGIHQGERTTPDLYREILGRCLGSHSEDVPVGGRCYASIPYPGITPWHVIKGAFKTTLMRRL